MALFGGKRRERDEGDEDNRYDGARDAYMNGRFKVVTTDVVEGRTARLVFGLVVTRGYNADTAFFGLVSRAMDAGADAIVGYRENVSFHPEGERHYSLYGTAILLDPLNKK